MGVTGEVGPVGGKGLILCVSFVFKVVFEMWF